MHESHFERDFAVSRYVALCQTRDVKALIYLKGNFGAEEDLQFNFICVGISRPTPCRGGGA